MFAEGFYKDSYLLIFVIFKTKNHQGNKKIQPKVNQVQIQSSEKLDFEFQPSSDREPILVNRGSIQNQ